MNERLRSVEKEMKRLEKCIAQKCHPTKVLNIENCTDINDEIITTAFQKIARLVHPDKNGSHERFVVVFQFVVEARELLRAEKPCKLPVETLTEVQNAPKSENLGEQQVETDEKDNNLVVPYQQDVALLQNNAVLTVKELLDVAPSELTPLMHIRRSEHTKNVRASAKEKHQNGIRQRKIQERAAQRRIERDHFSFCQLTK